MTFQKILFVSAFAVASLGASSAFAHDHHGDYRCTATGPRNDNHGGTHAISAHGFGDSLEEAQEDALEHCQTLTQGRGCRLNSCIETGNFQSAE